MNKLLIVILSIYSLLSFVNSQQQQNSSLFLNQVNYPGFVKISDKVDFFYWFFESRSNPETDPLVFWLTGGPGCSSLVALFTENGPFSILDNLTLQLNQYSWSNNSNIVFLDQPAGTGYSHSSFGQMAQNETRVAADFYLVLQGFLEQFPQFKGRELFVTGESYAGHYIPAIGEYIIKNPDEDINLVGLAIGNGWVDPYMQYPQYAEYAYQNKLIGKFLYNILRVSFAACQQLINGAQTFLEPLDECQLSMEAILGNPFKPRFNVYDIRQKCEDPPLCYNFTNVGLYLEQPEIIQALGVQGRKWVECKKDVHTMLLGDWLTNLNTAVSQILASGVRVLVYSGDQDFICNWLGGEAWVNAVNWEHKAAFNKQSYQQWSPNGQNYGEFKSIENFTFLRVYNAGHMVPMDQPEAALLMLNEFFNKWASQVRLQRALLKQQQMKEQSTESIF